MTIPGKRSWLILPAALLIIGIALRPEKEKKPVPAIIPGTDWTVLPPAGFSADPAEGRLRWGRRHLPSAFRADCIRLKNSLSAMLSFSLFQEAERQNRSAFAFLSSQVMERTPGSEPPL